MTVRYFHQDISIYIPTPMNQLHVFNSDQLVTIPTEPLSTVQNTCTRPMAVQSLPAPQTFVLIYSKLITIHLNLSSYAERSMLSPGIKKKLANQQLCQVQSSNSPRHPIKSIKNIQKVESNIYKKICNKIYRNIEIPSVEDLLIHLRSSECTLQR